MLSKNEVKYIQSLFQKKTREAEAVFVVEGPKIVEELLLSDYKVRKIYAVNEWSKPANNTTEVIRVDADELQRISGLQTANQVLAVVEQKLSSKPEFRGKLTLVLDGIQDPGNLGTIIRIADWFGVKQVVASNDTVELYNPKVIQSTMGSFTRVEVWYDDLPALLSTAGVSVYGALLNGRSVFEIDKVVEGVLVIGNESKGITEAVKVMISRPITIPRVGVADSLNAALATEIIFSNFVA